MTEKEKFENDLTYGKEGEISFVNYVQLKQPNWKFEYNNSNNINDLRGWDVKIIKPNETLLFEIKRDQKSKYTGNIAIEKKCVDNSISNYFIFILDDKCEEIYSITINNMKHMLTDKVQGFFCWGGDGKRSFMKIIKKDVFLKYAKKL